MIRTTSLETSKALKENGFRQDAYFNWLEMITEQGGVLRLIPQESLSNKYSDISNYYAAPTSDELLEELPESVTEHGVRYSMEIVRHKLFDEKKFFISYEDNDGCMLRQECSDNESLPEALAACWLFLKKEGLIK